MWIDTHCHLDYLAERGIDLQEVMREARACAIEQMVTIATRSTTPVNDYTTYPHVFGTVGIHPHNVEEDPVDLMNLRKLASQTRKLVAIGETGLDYYYDNADRACQRTAFETHITLAMELGLPIVIHTRDADEDTLAIMRAAYAAGQTKPQFILHCFTRDHAFAEAILELGTYISFSGIVTFKNAGHLKDIAATIPLDRMLIETDSPFLAPVPHRGKSNQPAYVADTAAFIAASRGIELVELSTALRANTYRVFPALGEGTSTS